MNIIRFCKNWTLPIAMVSGVLLYVVYVNIPALAPTKPFVARAVDIIQPLLIFTMLFLAFCKISLHDLRPCRWHLWSAADTRREFLADGIAPYTLAPLPRTHLGRGCHALHDMSYGYGFRRGNTQVGRRCRTHHYLHYPRQPADFVSCAPVASFGASAAGCKFRKRLYAYVRQSLSAALLCPFVATIPLRYLCPKLHARVAEYQDLSFYLWAVALTIAIAVTAKSVAHSDVSFWYQAGLAVISLVCCALQFIFGKRIGGVYGDSITAGQALGQKNTALAIWMGYTFFTPVTSLAAGFYSVWHNVVNSYQLYRKRKEEASSASE